MTRMLIAAVFFVAAAAAAPASADEPCTIATSGDSAVAQACKTGGRKQATLVMKEMVKQAKANGTAFKCIACHDDLDTYKLLANAKDDMKKLIQAAQKK